MRANPLQNALQQLGGAVREAEAALEEMRAESDPLAVHIFVSRRQFRNMLDTKDGKRSEVPADELAEGARLAFVAAWETADGCLGTLQVLFIHHCKAESSRRLERRRWMPPPHVLSRRIRTTPLRTDAIVLSPVGRPV